MFNRFQFCFSSLLRITNLKLKLVLMTGEKQARGTYRTIIVSKGIFQKICTCSCSDHPVNANRWAGFIIAIFAECRKGHASLK